MPKDIFIDNNVAKNFSNPLDPEYKKLIHWLLTSNDAYLVVSTQLLKEYLSTCANSPSATNITSIISHLTRNGRLIKITNEEIKAFKDKHFTKKIVKKLTCNSQDRNHIPVVLLSYRKYVLSLDKKFTEDLKIFPGFVVVTARKPQDLPYC